MSNPIEKAARAICQVRASDNVAGGVCAYPRCDCDHALVKAEARAAVLAFLDASMEPTNAMLNAVYAIEHFSGITPAASKTWKAMLSSLRAAIATDGT